MYAGYKDNVAYNHSTVDTSSSSRILSSIHCTLHTSLPVKLRNNEKLFVFALVLSWVSGHLFPFSSALLFWGQLCLPQEERSTDPLSLDLLHPFVHEQYCHHIIV